MRWKIQVINIGSKKTRKIKRLNEYINGIGAKIQIFIDELGEESETEHLTPVERLEKVGFFILELRHEIIEFRMKKS